MFKGYEEIGNPKANLIINTQGKIKIRWGNTYKDLLDENGNINLELVDISKLKELLK